MFGVLVIPKKKVNATKRANDLLLRIPLRSAASSDND